MRATTKGQQKLERENPEDRIEVIVCTTNEGSAILELRSLRWGPGIGWYVHKTIRLDPAQARTLAQALYRHSRTKPSGPAKVIPFPGR
ncbi:MAG: hypothetical protein HY695_03900 [Deltaproteobacteria bacterium]|nr:hypothetical protein [Deltaproteobacteria bacterium]